MTPPVTQSAAPISNALREIQAPVRGRLDEVAREMHTIMTADLPLIKEVAGHLLGMRGKLFRPTLALLASAVEDRPEPRALPLAALIELMHLATLVHDDSVDHSVLRRGLPTVNALFSHQISVIMGDLLYSRALRALVKIGDLEIIRILTDVSNELAMGEMHQLAAIDRLGFGEEDYFTLIRAKTASLIAAACESGALCGAPMHRAALARYGVRLGMAFQIADDILDYTESEAVTGKPGGLDLAEHKVTLPLIAALPRLSPAARRRVDHLFATESPEPDIVREVIDLVGEAGGIVAARQRGEQFGEEAVDALATLPDTPARAALRDAISYVLERRS
ncbi:MAG TPA: polyprenyl synthetase family protein [Gemmatimonadaceae bacterium]|nr:polyprenyl synthetase family protein [Gemmatimonadaceae bacterium]